jgi:predicted enzyme related to lactoylglutathione lyase
MLSQASVGRSGAIDRSGGRRSYEPGAFCWVGLATCHPAGAKAIYTSVFGWQSADLPADEVGTYTVPADGPIGRTAQFTDPQGSTFAVLEQPYRPRKETDVEQQRYPTP